MKTGNFYNLRKIRPNFVLNVGSSILTEKPMRLTFWLLSKRASSPHLNLNRFFSIFGNYCKYFLWSQIFLIWINLSIFFWYLQGVTRKFFHLSNDFEYIVIFSYPNPTHNNVQHKHFFAKYNDLFYTMEKSFFFHSAYYRQNKPYSPIFS